MRSLQALLLAAVCADAVIEFKYAFLVDEKDVNGYGYSFGCNSPGCTVYTTKMSSAEVGLYKGDEQLATLNTIYKKDSNGFLVGYHLAGGSNYKLKKTTTGEMTTLVKIYIVYDSVGSGAVVDFDSVTTDIDINASGKKTITVLNIYNSGVTFTNYKGTTSPKIYAAGFDAVDTTCKPIYTASSVDNAAKSKIGIVSALTTIDFGSTDASNRYHVAKYVATQNTVSIGQSAIVMSSGYTGCLVQKNYNDFAMATYDFKAGSESTKATINFGDLGISQGHELTLKVTGQSDKKISGYSDSQSYSYVATNMDVSIVWDQKDKSDTFFAQIDFTNGVSHVFGLSTLLAIFFALI